MDAEDRAKAGARAWLKRCRQKANHAKLAREWRCSCVVQRCECACRRWSMLVQQTELWVVRIFLEVGRLHLKVVLSMRWGYVYNMGRKRQCTELWLHAVLKWLMMMMMIIIIIDNILTHAGVANVGMQRICALIFSSHLSLCVAWICSSSIPQFFWVSFRLTPHLS